MSRTIPRAFVTAAWDENPVVAKAQAMRYCQVLDDIAVARKAKVIVTTLKGVVGNE